MLLTISAISFIILFAVYAQECLPAVTLAAMTFIKSVLPALFPFYVAAGLLMEGDFCFRVGKMITPVTKKLFGIAGEGALAIVIGLVSGYPAGAKITAELYENGRITYGDAKTLAAFTNNCGPLFIIGTIGTGMLGDGRLGLVLWGIHVLASLLTGMILKWFHRDSLQLSAASFKPTPVKAPEKSLPAISNAMTSAMYAMIPIAAAIIFFAAFTATLKASGVIPALASLFGRNAPAASGVLSGAIEITNGIQQLSQCPLPEILKLPLISAVAGWAGVSVHIQVIGILSKAGISCRKYLGGKILHACLAALLTLGFVCFLRSP